MERGLKVLYLAERLTKLSYQMRSLMHNTSSFQGRNYTSYQKKFDFSLTWVVRNEFTRLLIHNLRFSVCLLYPCKQRGGGGAILESQCLSIHLSCCLSVKLIFWASSTDLGGTCLKLNSLETCWFWLRKIKEVLIKYLLNV